MAALWFAAALHWLLLGSDEWVGCIPLQLVLAAVAVEMSVVTNVEVALELCGSVSCCGCWI